MKSNTPGVGKESFMLYFPEKYFIEDPIDKFNREEMDKFFKNLRLRIKRILKDKDSYYAPNMRKQMDHIDQNFRERK
jgi:hypothetical protein